MIKYLLLFTILAFSCKSKESVFKLDPNQSMLMTGKGPGQDGAINPYSGQKCIAVVENVGTKTFSVRVKSGDDVNNYDVNSNSIKSIILEVGDELYLDSEFNSKAKVTFEKYSENKS